MSFISISYFTSFLICLWLIFFILSKNPKELENRVCAMLIGSFAVWNFALTFYITSDSFKYAMFWINISSIGWCSFAGLAIWLALVKYKLMKWYFYPFIVLFPLFFIYKQWTGYLVFNLIKHSNGWSTVWSLSIWPLLFYAYYVSFIILSLSFVFISIKKRKYIFEKKRSKLIIVSAIIFLLAATITDILLPQLKVYVVPVIGSIFSVILAAGIVYSIARYNFMTLTPAYAASDILSTMSDSLILIDTEGKIIEANNSILNLLGYTKVEFIGSPAEILFLGQTVSNVASRWDILLKEDSFRDKMIAFRTKNGEYIPVSFSGICNER